VQEAPPIPEDTVKVNSEPGDSLNGGRWTNGVGTVERIPAMSQSTARAGTPRPRTTRMPPWTNPKAAMSPRTRTGDCGITQRRDTVTPSPATDGVGERR